MAILKRALSFNWTTANERLGDDEMFVERVLHWARIFDAFTCTMGTMVMRAKARANFAFNRPWESTAHARKFERELLARKALNESHQRLLIAR